MRLAFLMFGARVSAARRHPEVCEQKVPASLGTLLKERFPGFHPPRMTDQSARGTEFNKHEGGDGCITVATGDFNGDGRKDVALLLMNSRSVRLVVALRRSMSWEVYRLPTFCEATRSCYVETEKPGLFKRAEAFDTPLSSPDKRNQIRTQTENVLSGTVESTRIAYAYSRGKMALCVGVRLIPTVRATAGPRVREAAVPREASSRTVADRAGAGAGFPAKIHERHSTRRLLPELCRRK